MVPAIRLDNVILIPFSCGFGFSLKTFASIIITYIHKKNYKNANHKYSFILLLVTISVYLPWREYRIIYCNNTQQTFDFSNSRRARGEKLTYVLYDLNLYLSGSPLIFVIHYHISTLKM